MKKNEKNMLTLLGWWSMLFGNEREPTTESAIVNLYQQIQLAKLRPRPRVTWVRVAQVLAWIALCAALGAGLVGSI